MALTHWARKATVQQVQREFSPGKPSGARAPGLNLTGGAQAPVREREARERRG